MIIRIGNLCRRLVGLVFRVSLACKDGVADGYTVLVCDYRLADDDCYDAWWCGVLDMLGCPEDEEGQEGKGEEEGCLGRSDRPMKVLCVFLDRIFHMNRIARVSLGQSLRV